MPAVEPDDGTYWLDPNGAPHTDAFQAYCDMTRNGGGWTLVSRFSNADTKNWMEDTGQWWYDEVTPQGTTTSPTANLDMLGLNQDSWRVSVPLC